MGWPAGALQDTASRDVAASAESRRESEARERGSANTFSGRRIRRMEPIIATDEAGWQQKQEHPAASCQLIPIAQGRSKRAWEATPSCSSHSRQRDQSKPASSGTSTSVPPPAMALTAPARNADEQSRVELQTGAGIVLSVLYGLERFLKRVLGFAVFCLVLLGFEAAGPICFKDVAAESGMAFVLQNSPTPEKRMIETMAGGLAIFDYNNDGRPDIYFTNGADVPSLKKSSPKYANRLFRNDGNMKFTAIRTLK